MPGNINLNVLSRHKDHVKQSTEYATHYDTFITLERTTTFGHCGVAVASLERYTDLSLQLMIDALGLQIITE